MEQLGEAPDATRAIAHFDSDSVSKHDINRPKNLHMDIIDDENRAFAKQILSALLAGQQPLSSHQLKLIR